MTDLRMFHKSFFPVVLTACLAAGTVCFAGGNPGDGIAAARAESGRESGSSGAESEDGIAETCAETESETASAERESGCGRLILEDPSEETEYAAYEVSVGDIFSIEFVHSVNKSPVIDYFEIREDGIYGIRTVYYGFGAGVPTDLEEGQELSFGEDGSMIISGFERKMSSLIYRVGTVSDHILTLEDGTKISLRKLCGRNARVAFRFEEDTPDLKKRTEP